MNKKILNLVACFLVVMTFLIYIGAQENSSTTNDENIIEEDLTDNLQEENIISENSVMNNSAEESQDESSNKTSLEIIYENIDDLNTTQNKTNIFGNNLNDSADGEINVSEENFSISTNEKKNAENNSEEMDKGVTGENKKDNRRGDLVSIGDLIKNDSNSIDNESREEENCAPKYVRGEKIIEAEKCIDGWDKIEIEENKISDLEKEIIISNEEHFNEPLRFYSKLTTEAKENEIKIIWKNNDSLEISSFGEYKIEYYDENKNGLIDKVSWIVPHLSEQIFEIVIKLEKINSSSELLLEVGAPEGEVKNPINFNITVNYSGDVNCSLGITNREEIYFDSSEEISLDLPNGSYNWNVACYDISNKEYDESGSFSVNESFSVSLENNKDFYLLDLVKNELSENGIVEINSGKSSDIIVEIKRKDSQDTNFSPHANFSLIGIRNYDFNLNKTVLNKSGIYNLTVHFDSPSAESEESVIFYVASANLSFNDSTIKKGEKVKITAKINSPLKFSNPTLIYGDGSSPDIWGIQNITGNWQDDFEHQYNSNGTYNVNLTIHFGANLFNIQRNGIVVSAGSDSEEPEIDLINPEGEDIFYTNNPANLSIYFSYEAEDNINLTNCTFKLYEDCTSMEKCSSAKLAYSQINKSKSKNLDIEIRLTKFELGYYMWTVGCYDNSSNYFETGDLYFGVLNKDSTVTAQSSNDKEDVEEVKKKVDEFISADYSLEEKEVLEDLGIMNETAYYKKRLAAFEASFTDNYKSELEEIKDNLPKKILVSKDYDYVKNSVDIDWEDLIKDYFESTNTDISGSSIRKLAKENKELQNYISTSASIKNVEIEYEDRTEKITLIKKEIGLEEDSAEKILEYIPGEIVKGEIVFLSDNEKVNDNMFVIENLDEEIIYYFSEQIDVDDAETTETLLFEDSIKQLKVGFTGFVVFDAVSGENTIFFAGAFALFSVLFFLVPLVFRKFEFVLWEKEPNVVKVFNLIDEIKKRLRENEIERARENYYKIKVIYPVLPQKTKHYFYKKINDMSAKIDKKDIFNLVREYQEAKKKWNQDNYMRLYKEIKEVYKRLPEKDRKIVHKIINDY